VPTSALGGEWRAGGLRREPHAAAVQVLVLPSIGAG